MRLVPAGDRALLVELGAVSAGELHAAAERASAVPGVVRCTPGHSSLYVVFEGSPDRPALEAALEADSEGRTVARASLHRLPVTFDGPDFAEFLSHAGLTPGEFRARLPALRLVARYLGFRGGFAYLDGWPAEWSMPRRPTSRPVRRGSFAIAGSVAAFYPVDSPGGWNVLGTTEVELEDAIAPGDVIELTERAEPRGAGSGGRPAGAPPQRSRPKPVIPRAELLLAPLALWTDRPFDDVAAGLANRAVGNAPGAALLECPLAGPRVRFTADAVIAWCTPDLQLAVEQVGEGEERAFGRVTGGLRAYLAIGTREGSTERIVRGERHVIRAMSGPHEAHLHDVVCEVTPQLDRVGIRLRPLQPLNIAIPADLRSIGMQTGTVQLHPDGSLLAMGPDHPVTGGYLQPMTVLSGERWKLAQLAPGERVRFEIRAPEL